MVYILSKHKLPSKGWSAVRTNNDAQRIAKKIHEKTGKPPYIYKVSAPKMNTKRRK